MLHRTINRRCAAAIALLAFASAALAEHSSSPEPAHGLAGAALVAALRGGGSALETGRLVFRRAGPSTVVRGYGSTSSANAGPPHLEEGEAAVLKSEGSDFVVVARIKRGDWRPSRRRLAD